MRKIERDMMQAIHAHTAWRKDNTEVKPIDAERVAVYLFGNHIADVHSYTGQPTVNHTTLADWPTRTTRSRLRAMGANI